MLWSFGSVTFHLNEPPFTMSFHVSAHVMLVVVVVDDDTSLPLALVNDIGVDE